MPRALKIAAALMVALASAAIGWFGVKWWQDAHVTAEPSPSASSTPTATSIAYVHLTFDNSKVVAAASAVMQHPACGDTWSGDATAANGVVLTAEATLDDEDGVDTLSITSNYTPEGQDPVAFVGAEGYYIVTRDGVVISPDWGGEYVPQYFVAIPGSKTPAGEGVSLTGPTLCDVSGQLAEIWANVDFDTATPEDIQAAQDATDAFNAEHAELPSGEYKIYAVAPIIVGEPAAIARALNDEGVSNIGTLSYSIGDTPLADDPRLEPYCTDQVSGEGDVTIRVCDVPQDVLDEVLARDVPQEYVVDGAPALAISKPVTITIP
ncbi:MAG: hypothetical protein NVV57_04070 [Demequina sp.]|nr:hypothetical protein [Demequina sp.]